MGMKITADQIQLGAKFKTSSGIILTILRRNYKDYLIDLVKFLNEEKAELIQTDNNKQTTMSTQAQHTPGPWKASWTHRINNGRRTGTHVVMREGSVNEHYWIPQFEGCEEDEANARLIAAAPELLEALKKINSLLDDEFQSKDELVPPSIVEAYNIIDNVTKNL